MSLSMYAPAEIVDKNGMECYNAEKGPYNGPMPGKGV